MKQIQNNNNIKLKYCVKLSSQTETKTMSAIIPYITTTSTVVT